MTDTPSYQYSQFFKELYPHPIHNSYQQNLAAFANIHRPIWTHVSLWLKFANIDIMASWQIVNMGRHSQPPTCWFLPFFICTNSWWCGRAGGTNEKKTITRSFHDPSYFDQSLSKLSSQLIRPLIRLSWNSVESFQRLSVKKTAWAKTTAHVLTSSQQAATHTC